jgi:hypothetical protein
MPEDSPINPGQPGKVFYPTEFCPLGIWHAQSDKGEVMDEKEIAKIMEQI